MWLLFLWTLNEKTHRVISPSYRTSEGTSWVFVGEDEES